jgi:hypothetical protein
VKVQPGEKYLCYAWASCSKRDASVGATLSVRWQAPDGSWHPKRDLEPKTEMSVQGGRWERLSVVANVPEGAGRLVFMLNAANQTGDEAVVYDDAAVIRMP